MAIRFQQRTYALRIGGSDDEPGMMFLVQSHNDLRSIVGRGIGRLLLGEAEDAAGVVLAQIGKAVLFFVERGDF